MQLYTHTCMAFYKTRKKEIISFVKIVIELEVLMMSKIGQIQKDKY